MRGATHLAAGIALAAIMPELSATEAAALALGSLLPDIDSPTSIVGRKVPVIPALLPHRTVTHSLVFLAVLYLLCPALSYGATTHIVLDYFNPEGIPLFWPWKAKQHAPVICRLLPSGGFLDRLLGALLWFFALYAIISLSGIANQVISLARLLST